MNYKDEDLILKILKMKGRDPRSDILEIKLSMLQTRSRILLKRGGTEKLIIGFVQFL